MGSCGHLDHLALLISFIIMLGLQTSSVPCRSADMRSEGGRAVFSQWEIVTKSSTRIKDAGIAIHLRGCIVTAGSRKGLEEVRIYVEIKSKKITQFRLEI